MYQLFIDFDMKFDLILLLFGFEHARCETSIFDDSIVDLLDLPIGKKHAC